MAIKIPAALSKAAGLTRARKLLEATRLIQDSLSGRATEAQPKPSAEAPGARPDPGRRPKRPLADVVDVLARAKRDGLGPLRAPGAPGGPAAPTHSPRPAAPAGSRFLARSHSGPAGARSYKLYVPARPLAAPPALVLMLHGCTQDPDDFAAGTGMNELAEEFGILVAYPAQPRSANASGCWNWFERKDQQRDRGEPAILAGIAREVAAEFGVPPDRIFAAGLSAGGAMAAILGATYPDLFSAVGIHSGLAYGAASDMPGAFMAMRGERGLAAPLARAAADPAAPAIPVRTIVFHGDADQTVHPSNAERIVATLSPGAGRGAHAQRSGSAGGRTYSRTIIMGADGVPVGEHWAIAGAGHAWSGGNPAGSYADPRGPNASREMLRFFLEGRRAGP